jgi:regulator of ribosome biosynthesis
VDYDPVSEDRKERKERKLKNDQQRLKNAARASQQLQSKDGAARSAPSASDRTERRAALDRQLLTTKSSTASRGKFDKTLEGEPKSKGLKRKVRTSYLEAFIPLAGSTIVWLSL